jgi:hypothetical protein
VYCEAEYRMCATNEFCFLGVVICDGYVVVYHVHWCDVAFFMTQEGFADFGSGTIGSDYDVAFDGFAVCEGGCDSYSVFVVCYTAKVITVLFIG